jgi:hypothetical protein
MESVLRVNSRASPESLRLTLSKAVTKLFSVYPNSEIFCNVTANVVLEHTVFHSYSVYFGQRFSSECKEVLFGMEHDEHDNITKKCHAFQLTMPTDSNVLPVKFSTEYFSELFKKNFSNSNVRVHSVINLIYKFTKAMIDYDDEAKTGQRWVRLF